MPQNNFDEIINDIINNPNNTNYFPAYNNPKRRFNRTFKTKIQHFKIFPTIVVYISRRRTYYLVFKILRKPLKKRLAGSDLFQ